MGSRAKHRNLLTDPLPETIYFDTNFVIYSLIKQKPHYYKNLACRYFIDRLINSKTKVYFSAIIFPEFWHSALKIAIAKDRGYREEGKVYNYLRKHKVEAVKKHITFIKYMQGNFDNLMNLLNKKERRVYVVETCRAISEEAIRFMEDYQLLSYDAIHFASSTIKMPSATDKGLDKPSVFDIATIDSDFELVKCKYLNVWNRGCDYKSILKYEKGLKKEKLQPDGILLKSK
jgi:predicted nucleic acid-binding protein